MDQFMIETYIFDVMRLNDAIVMLECAFEEFE